jgi:hypothetical protein
VIQGRQPELTGASVPLLHLRAADPERRILRRLAFDAYDGKSSASTQGMIRHSWRSPLLAGFLFCFEAQRTPDDPTRSEAERLLKDSQ